MSRNILLVIVSLMFITTFNMYGQDSPVNNEGTEFWLSFPPNYHSGGSQQDSVFIFISSRVACSGTITVLDIKKNLKTYNFTINDPKIIFQKGFLFSNYEIPGYSNNAGNSGSMSETAVPAYFLIETTEPVSVYAHSQSYKSSDACMVLPKHGLGTEYYVMSYKSDDKYSFNRSNATPSQFLILTTEDNTSITIKPSDDTYINRKNIQNIMLPKKGTSYLVHALVNDILDDRSTNPVDLTGSYIESDKPIAVFGSHQRAEVPYSSNVSDNNSRDFLIEQLLPVNLWGRNAIVTPFAFINMYYSNRNDKYRVLAANDSTEVKVNGNIRKILDAGEFYEDDIINAMYIEASAPICVASLKRTSGTGNSPSESDPFLLINSPVEHYKNSYRVLNTQSKESGFLSDLFEDQYLNLVIKTVGISDIRIDGTAIPANSFTQVGNSEYSYVNYKVSDGIHDVNSIEPFSIVVYGYGEANSYGYLGGIGISNIDYKPPTITSDVKCYDAHAFLADTSRNDSKLKSVLVESFDNINYKISDFKALQATAEINANLINRYKDGYIAIQAVDSAQFSTSRRIDIPGFTVDFNNSYVDTNLIANVSETKAAKSYCFTKKLYNYGKFNQTINKLKFKHSTPEFTVKPEGPFIIARGASLDIEVCFNSPLENVYLDTLVISNDCISRDILSFRMQTLGDKDKPAVKIDTLTCGDEFIMSIYDSLVTDFGLENVKVDSTYNCTYDLTISSTLKYAYKLTLKDKNKDGYIKVSAKDYSGNVTVFEMDLPGFTIDVLASSLSADSEFDFGNVDMGSVLCKELEFNNYGKHDIVINNARLSRNIEFSIPRAQLPFVVPANSKKSIEICYMPLKAKNIYDKDSIEMIYHCIPLVFVLNGIGDELAYSIGSKCDVNVNFNSDSISKKAVLHKISPNPASDVINLSLTVFETKTVTITLTDIIGSVDIPLFSGKLKVGESDFAFPTGNFPNGVYLLNIRTDEYYRTEKINLVK